FKVEQQPQRLPDAPIGEDRAARIEHESQQIGWRAFFKVVLDNPSLFDRREIIELLPAGRVCFDKDVEQPLLEGLEKGSFVAIIFDCQSVEIVEAALGG